MAEINFENIEYSKLDKQKKLAAFLITIGPEAAAEILKTFSDSEAEAICRDIAEMHAIDEELKIKITDEFSEIIGRSMGVTLGGSDFAQNALMNSRGEYKAANMLSRIAPVSSSSEVIAELSEMQPRQIFNLIRNEHPQTIAFIISHMNKDNATMLLSMLSQKLREDVVELIGSMEGAPVEMVGKVVNTIKKHMDSGENTTIHRPGGTAALAELLNGLEKDVTKSLLEKLEEKNPALSAAIRKKMFGFEDLVKLGIPDLQRIARDVDMQDLTIAMKSASPALQDAFFQSVSKRAAETLRDEIDMLGPMKLKDVEAAQDRIIQVVRKLEEEGEISLGDDGEMV